jgi:hypothetical protein
MLDQSEDAIHYNLSFAMLQRPFNVTVPHYHSASHSSKYSHIA